MKIGNAPLPISEHVVRQGTSTANAGKSLDSSKEGDAAFRVELSAAAGKKTGSAITTAAEALEVATEIRNLVAESNREAASVQQGLDPKRLLDLLA